MTKDLLLDKLRKGTYMTLGEQFRLTMFLALPTILAQLSMCLMSYIDASMVGRLGSGEAASIGLVSSTSWIFGGLCYANSTGFSVQIAHKCGAGDFQGAKSILRQGLASVLGLSLLLGLAGTAISGKLPLWLGGSAEIAENASGYFLIFAAFLPVFQVTVFAEAALVASGNTRIPSLASLAMCLLDVAFNYIFIFVLGKGVKGAAIGTGLSELCCGLFLLAYACLHCPALKQTDAAGSDRHKRKITRKSAFGISWPLWIQNIVTRGAQIAATVIVAPLGTAAIAANSFAVIAEGFCYLPGFGMQDAATTLTGQSLGAGRRNLARSFARITIGSGAAMMTVLSVLMWVFAPEIMGLLSKDPEVVALGTKCLRIEAWAETLFGVSIVAYGCCVGAGDTLVPSIINVGSMWVVRLGLALLLIPYMGLAGYWMGMAVELSMKGIVFAFRIHGGRWLDTRYAEKST